jgi:uncharacterized repeat protein (TIGR03803 family)
MLSSALLPVICKFLHIDSTAKAAQYQEISRERNMLKPVPIAFLFLAMTAISAPAQTFTTLHTFDLTDGAYPSAPLVQGLDGNLYGTTYAGARNICLGGCGTVFKITRSGAMTTVHEFISTDGQNPEGLVLTSSGSFYGTTASVGPGGDTIFEITAGGALVASYTSSASFAPLLQYNVNGEFYGTSPTPDIFGYAAFSDAIFSMTADGTVSTLHSFCNFKTCGGTAGGYDPRAPVIEATNEFFYGTTFQGGANGDGTIFEIGAGGALKRLYSFTGLLNSGAGPAAGLIQASDGNLYGTTELGGGTVFKITLAGVLTVLHNFNAPDYGVPLGALIQATDGNFYGTTWGTGIQGVCSNNDCGTVFKMTPDGTFTTVHSFDKSDGMNPTSALVQGTDGNLYGVTRGFNGQHLYGTVFQLSLGLAPFVRTVPTAAYPGTTVFILGTDLTGATSVTFNGKAAAFTVVSETEITATVPKGSTTGTVQVITPSGTLSSNIAFKVF